MPRSALAKLEILTEAIIIDDRIRRISVCVYRLNWAKYWAKQGAIFKRFNGKYTRATALQRDLSHILSLERDREIFFMLGGTHFSPARRSVAFLMAARWLPTCQVGKWVALPPSQLALSSVAIKCTIHLRINLRRFLQSHKACDAAAAAGAVLKRGKRQLGNGNCLRSSCCGVRTVSQAVSIKISRLWQFHGRFSVFLALRLSDSVPLCLRLAHALLALCKCHEW